MASQWYYSKGSQQFGPVSSSQVRELIQTGQLLATDLIWKAGMAGWVAAGSQSKFFPQGAVSPPPPPPVATPQLSVAPQSELSKQWAEVGKQFQQLVGGVIVCILLCGGCGWWISRSVQHNSPPTIAESEVPTDQREFVRKVEVFIQPYKDAPNELKKSALRQERKNTLRQSLPSLEVNNWVGTLRNMTTTSEGHAHVEVQLGGSKVISIGNWNNSLSDIGSGTLIPHGTPLYNTISNLATGDQIVFSGNFFPSSKDLDYIRERSVTEEGSVTEPEFLFKFTEVRKK